MSQDTQNFEPLRRLLALKRYEQPPPGYFQDFSQQVIIRIQSGERGEESAFIERLLWEAPWLRRIWAALEARPILAGVSGVAVCALLLAGMIYSDKTEVTNFALIPVAETAADGAALATNTMGGHPFLTGAGTLAESPDANPLTAMPAEGAFLGDLTQLRAQPASFNFSGGN